MDIVEYSGNATEWDKYVLRSEAATIYHQIGWKDVIEKTFGHKPYYLIAKENGEVKGILPLFLMQSKIFGSYLVSIPFFDYGGVIADNQEVAQKLITKAIEIAKENKVEFLELRHNIEIPDERLVSKTTKVSFFLTLNPDPQEIWKSVLDQNKRNKIRKANKHLSVRFCQSKEDIVICYRIFSEAMRDLGTPVYPIKLFRNIYDVFSDHVKMLLAIHEDKVVGAKIIFLFKDRVYFRFHYSLREFFKFAPNDLLYWAAIEYACKNGYKFCDLGRCTNASGNYDFKRKFGAQEKQLYYQYYLNGRNELPDVSPSNKKFRLAIAVWKRLPLFITEMIGPKIVRNIP